MGFGMMAGLGLIGLLVSFIVIVGVIWGIVWALRRYGGSAGGAFPSGGTQSPRDILQTRYARGEIDREQYQNMLKDLGRGQ